MAEFEKVVKGLERCQSKNCDDCPYKDEKDETYSGLCQHIMENDALELLKEHDEQKRKWLLNIADNQLANAPTETMDAGKKIFYRGIWHGLQMAYDILTEET